MAEKEATTTTAVGEDLLAVARKLKEELGVNVLFVGRDKAPVGVSTYRDLFGRWQSMEELEAMWERAKGVATGIAILGNYVNKGEYRYPQYRLLIVDVDDPRVFRERYAEALPRSTLEWSTGPRCPEDMEKHGITCTPTPDGKDYECVHRAKDGQVHTFRLSEHNEKRGLAMLYVVREECLREVGLIDENGNAVGTKRLAGGAIELRLLGYELFPPSLHPSNVPYEMVEEKLALTELPCEALRKMLEVEGQEQQKQEQKREAERRGGGRGRQRELSDGQVRELVELIEPYYVAGFRDTVLFSVLSFLASHHVSEETARKFVEEVLKKFSDEEAGKRLDTVRQAYKRDDKGKLHVWSKRKIIEEMTQVIAGVVRERTGNEVDRRTAQAEAVLWLSRLERIVGVGRTMVLVSRRGLVGRKNAEVYIASMPDGVWQLVKWLPSGSEVRAHVREDCRRRCVGQGRDCVEECVARVMSDEALRRDVERALTRWGYDVLINGVYIERVREIVDAVTGTRYFDVVFTVKTKKGWKRRRVVGTVDDLLEDPDIEGRVQDVKGLSHRRVLLNVLTALSEGVGRKYVVAGIVYSKKKQRPALVYRGRYGPALRRLMSEEGGDPSVVDTYIRKYLRDDPMLKAKLALACFQSFSFLRKQFGLRTHAVVSYGEPRTGKSTMDQLVACVMTGISEYEKGDPLRCSLVYSAATVFSPARLGRVFQFTTFPVVVDEGKDIAITPQVADVLKHALTGKIAYEYAVPGKKQLERLPAYSGILINTNVWRPPNDPGVVDRVFAFEHTRSMVITEEREREFMEWIGNPEVRRGLRAFFRLFLRTVVDDWDKVQGIILDPDDIRASQEYFRYVMKQKLGLDIDFGDWSWQELRARATADSDEVGKLLDMVQGGVRSLARLVQCVDCDMYSLYKLEVERQYVVTLGWRVVKELEENDERIYVCFPDSLLRRRGIMGARPLAERLCASLNEKVGPARCRDVDHGTDLPGSAPEAEELLRIGRITVGGGREVAVCIEANALARLMGLEVTETEVKESPDS